MTILYGRTYYTGMSNEHGAKEKAIQISKMVEQCIEEYKVFLNDTMSLDAAGIYGKYRALVLSDETYRVRTRQIRALRVKKDIQEVDDIYKEITNISEIIEDTDDLEEDTFTADDFMDNPFDIDKRLGSKNKDKKKESKQPDKTKKSKDSIIKHSKDLLAMKFKASELRRSMQNINKIEEEAEEANAINYFFIPLTREEFEELEITEVHENKDIEGSVDPFADASTKIIPKSTKGIEDELNAMKNNDSYIEYEDGTIEEL